MRLRVPRPTTINNTWRSICSNYIYNFTRFWNTTTPAANTPDSVADSIGRHLFGGQMPDRLKAQVKTYLGAAALSQSRVREAVALALSSATYNWL